MLNPESKSAEFTVTMRENTLGGWGSIHKNVFESGLFDNVET